MFEILTVCTGNICRSPLAQLLLQERLRPLRPRVAATVTSAGTRGLRDAPMTPETIQIAKTLGTDRLAAKAHRSRLLTEAHLAGPDLILAMSREHRRHIVELAPARTRATFTIREFARLAAEVPDDDIRRAAAEAGADASARVRATAMVVATYRGLVPLDDPAEDDVIDPYRRSVTVYEYAAAQLTPAVDAVVRTLTLALTDSPAPP